MKAASLYVSYDGLLEPIGQSQVLPYVEGLADAGIAFTLLTFEKPADLADRDEVSRLRARVARRRIRWVPLRYHKSPTVPATAWDVLRGVAVAVWLGWRVRADVIHVRGYVGGMIGLAARAVIRAAFVFDMRGFWPEERVEGGLWRPGGRLFRAAKRVERRLLGAAGAVIVLTEPARRMLAGGAYRAARPSRAAVAVIPCCVDIDRFVPSRAGQAGPRTLVYAGSVGTRYMLAEMLDFHRAARARDPELRLLIVSRGPHDAIERAIAAAGAEGVSVIAATPAEMPVHLARAWAGICFVKPTFSKQGVFPIKLGEYLAAGLPAIVNAGVGGTDEIVADHRVGVVVDRFAPESYLAAWDALVALTADPGLRARCRETARGTLSLADGVARYREVYEQLLGGLGPGPTSG